MTQHDFEFADQLFPAMRTDMNNALIALSTRQAGTGAPALVAAARPNRLYVDITRKQVLVRDNADTTDFIWDSWGQERLRILNEAAPVALPEDVGRLLVNVYGTAINLSLPQAVGNFASSWYVDVYNHSTTPLYVVPTAPSLIQGLTSLALMSGQGAKIVSSAGNYTCGLTGKGNVTTAEMNTALAGALVPTGAIFPFLHYGIIPAGYVRLMGGSIGNASSGASERAHADCYPLYSYFWGLCDNTACPVAGGRGSDAAYDFNRNAYLVMPDMRGRTLFGLDLGTGRLTGAAPGGINGSAHCYPGGEQMHTLAASEIPPHQHTVSVPSFADTSLGGGPYALHYANTTGASGTDGGIGVYGYAHNTCPPGMAVGCWIAKL